MIRNVLVFIGLKTSEVKIVKVVGFILSQDAAPFREEYYENKTSVRHQRNMGAVP